MAYHPNVRCVRGGGGVGPVIVGPMYRVGEDYVCEEKATKEEKEKGPVEPAKVIRYRGDTNGPPVEGSDLRSWAAADIERLRGADGKLDLKGAILCGVELRNAQLQGATLCHAQLQGAQLREAQLQGANLYQAGLQGARLYEAQLQGALLRRAQLQGAELIQARLQGAELSFADLSVLPKGFPLPKGGAAGETEVTKEDRPTLLKGANLSVLPKGSKFCDRDLKEVIKSEVKVSDAARPTNLTDAKASRADFTNANLSGATFTAATLKDATLGDATFTPFRPPERPALGALSGAWQIKSLLGSVGRAVVAAADNDDDDDDDDSDGESEQEEKLSPEGVEFKMNVAVKDHLRKLAIGAPVFMRAVDKLLSKLEERKASLLANGALKDQLSKELEKVDANKAVINDILATLVISPLLEFIRAYPLPEVLGEVPSELSQPTDDGVGADAGNALPSLLPDIPLISEGGGEGGGGDGGGGAGGGGEDGGGESGGGGGGGDREVLSELPQPTDEAWTAGKQLLSAFKEQVLGAGKATLLKRLSPIVSKCVRASSRARCVRREPAVDEEQALMQPKLMQPGDAADCLVHELWPALLASLEAQVCATPQPIYD